MERTLSEILENVGVLEYSGSRDIRIKQLSLDSRVAGKDILFAALKGTREDGHKYIDQACENGATAVLCEKFPYRFRKRITYIRVADTSKALGIVASNFYHNPSYRLKLIGITGTNGKTTVATLLHQLFKKMGYNTGLLSTVCISINEKQLETTHTTPDAITTNRFLGRMVDQDCEFCFIEVSSHAIHQNRIEGLRFKGAVFTNITHDHLDYHADFKDYIHTKKRLFDNLTNESFALVNVDDKNAGVMIQNSPAGIHSYSLRSMSDYRGIIKEKHFEGMLIQLQDKEIWTRLTGEFNAYNILAVYAAACIMGQDHERILKFLSELEPVNGRFQVISSGQGIKAIVDYAHTPDALKNILETIMQIKKKNQKVIVVVGAGGNRDKEKRPLMAQIAGELCDQLILTSDNPRDEEPERIIEDMINGLDNKTRKKMVSIMNRKEAIKTACMVAGNEDIVLVAGKGHEKYQEIKGIKHHFDDVEVLKDILEN